MNSIVIQLISDEICPWQWFLTHIASNHNLHNKLQWRHNEQDSVSNHQPHDCFLDRLFRRRSKKTSKLRVTGLCAGNSPGTGEFPAQMASNAESVSILWRHHELPFSLKDCSRWHRAYWGLGITYRTTRKTSVYIAPSSNIAFDMLNPFYETNTSHHNPGLALSGRYSAMRCDMTIFFLKKDIICYWWLFIKSTICPRNLESMEDSS